MDHLTHEQLNTIKCWASSVECEPVFQNQVFTHLQDNLEEDNKDCVLLVEEMSIKKDALLEAQTKTFVENVDYGKIMAEKQDATAENGLVVMAVGLKQPWNYRIEFFLMKVAVAAQTLSNSVASGIRYLKAIGIPKFQASDETSP
ncbi:Hypothetical predicted protein, partial [Paramuricea clavata]